MSDQSKRHDLLADGHSANTYNVPATQRLEYVQIQSDGLIFGDLYNFDLFASPYNSYSTAAPETPRQDEL
jgi:hypothetical protein